MNNKTKAARAVSTKIRDNNPEDIALFLRCYEQCSPEAQEVIENALLHQVKQDKINTAKAQLKAIVDQADEKTLFAICNALDVLRG